MEKAGEDIGVLIRPILDTYRANQVGLIGCRALGTARPPCEYDVIVVSPERRAPISMRVGATYFDVLFKTESEVLNPSEPEFSLALASLVPIKDASLLLASASSTAVAVRHQVGTACAEARLGEALKALGRAEDALNEGRLSDADFWLTSSALDYSYAALYASSGAPSPSHLLRQMKELSKHGAVKFAEWSSGLGLEYASKENSLKKLDALSVILDVVRSAGPGMNSYEGLHTLNFPEAFEIISEKVNFLVNSRQSVDAYAFLCYGTVQGMTALLKLESAKSGKEPDAPRIVSGLTSGDSKILSEKVAVDAGFSRSDRVLRRNVEGLRIAVSSLAKKI
jgi:hypothetical protein